MKPDERLFETAICDSLIAFGGYNDCKVGTHTRDYDRARGLDTADLFAFIGATQKDAFERLVTLYGGDYDSAQRGFADRVAKQIDERGTVDVLRHGVVD